MARSAHQRRRRYLTSEALPAGFVPETGTLMARLWILRLLSRGGAKLLKEVGNHTTMALHLGVALQAQPEPEDDDFEALPQPELTPALVRRLLHSAETDPASHTLPEPLASNIRALAQELGLDQTAAQVLAFCVLLASDNQLEEACNALGSLNDNRSLLHQSGLLRMDHSTNYLSNKFDLLTGEFAARMVHYPMTPIEVLRGLLHLAPAALLHTRDTPTLPPTCRCWSPIYSTRWTRSAAVSTPSSMARLVPARRS